MIQGYVVQLKECWGDVAEAHEQDSLRVNWQDTKVYIDDILMKSLKRVSHLEDLENIFKRLECFKMRLNPAKCVFRVRRNIPRVLDN